ncbi:MAG: 4-(cytidine 5'-diphospho)-2-C-methyl-D-erythritol kinase [Clostridia bacterium]|nr:4-(cytidine 5'-diphospho)-2-C-methyl-D-erythritol kinase [Clostridia bacterium]
MNISVNAPAKINLYLDVVSRLDNGFHEIESIMQTVSLHDTVHISVEPCNDDTISLYCSNPDIPQDERNIAWKAARMYLDTFDVQGYSIDIKIEKRIPVCAGLAGGSTDAAAVLLALNSLFNKKASTDDLLECAARLGSDVPFCLVRGTMLTEGRGEIMKDVSRIPDCALLICSSGESVSTPWAYAELDRLHGDFKTSKRSVGNFIECLNNGNLNDIAKNMYNIFEDAVFPACPLAEKSKDLLLKNGAIGAMMSGSGSSVFGIFADEETAIKAKSALDSSERQVYLCRPQ